MDLGVFGGLEVSDPSEDVVSCKGWQLVISRAKIIVLIQRTEQFIIMRASVLLHIELWLWTFDSKEIHLQIGEKILERFAVSFG